jgi:hypothetical protein
MRRSGDISLSALLEGHLPGLLEQLRLPLFAAPFKRLDARRASSASLRARFNEIPAAEPRPLRLRLML